MTGQEFLDGCAAPVSRGDAWGDPLWTFYNETANMSLDVHGATLADAQANVLASFEAPPPTPADLAAVQAQMRADNLAATFKTPDEVAAASAQIHSEAKAGIANFKSDLAAWPTLTDAEKISHVEGLMQSMVGVLQHLTGDYA
jgi:hypothetical protein